MRIDRLKNNVDDYEKFDHPNLIVGSLSGSRLKSVRFLVGESGADVTSTADRQIIKINHQLNWVLIGEHPFGYRDTSLRIQGHLAPNK
jgi:hypothetical protein